MAPVMDQRARRPRRHGGRPAMRIQSSQSSTSIGKRSRFTEKPPTDSNTFFGNDRARAHDGVAGQEPLPDVALPVRDDHPTVAPALGIDHVVPAVPRARDPGSASKRPTVWDRNVGSHVSSESRNATTPRWLRRHLGSEQPTRRHCPDGSDGCVGSLRWATQPARSSVPPSSTSTTSSPSASPAAMVSASTESTVSGEVPQRVVTRDDETETRTERECKWRAGGRPFRDLGAASHRLAGPLVGERSRWGSIPRCLDWSCSATARACGTIEPVHRLVRLRPHRQGPGRGAGRRQLIADAACARRRSHSLQVRAIRTASSHSTPMAGSGSPSSAPGGSTSVTTATCTGQEQEETTESTATSSEVGGAATTCRRRRSPPTTRDPNDDVRTPTWRPTSAPRPNAWPTWSHACSPTGTTRSCPTSAPAATCSSPPTATRSGRW